MRMGRRRDARLVKTSGFAASECFVDQQYQTLKVVLVFNNFAFAGGCTSAVKTPGTVKSPLPVPVRMLSLRVLQGSISYLSAVKAFYFLK